MYAVNELSLFPVGNEYCNTRRGLPEMLDLQILHSPIWRIWYGMNAILSSGIDLRDDKIILSGRGGYMSMSKSNFVGSYSLSELCSDSSSAMSWYPY